MEGREEKEEKNKRVGWLVSVGIQLFMLVLFYFLVAWKAPFPPIPQYGIELGFSQSAGAAPPVQAKQQEEILEEEVSDEQSELSEEVPEEVADEPVEDAQPTETQEPVAEDIEPEVAVVEESEIPVETTEQEVVKEVLPEVEEATEEPEQAKETESKETEQVEQEGVEEVENPSDTDAKEVAEEPSIDERAIYGSQGASTGNQDGASLALAGWIWDFKPKPEDDSDETGKIVYKIVVDQDGYLVKIETVTSTVSPSVERKYRQSVSKLTFSKTSDYKPASLSTGTLTFIIKTR